MKLILNSFVVFILFFSMPLFGNSFFKTYIIKVSGIKIGKLDWEVRIDNENYINKITLQSEGVLSGLYKFDGNYFSKGTVEKKEINPEKYRHIWSTKKNKKEMDLVFNNNKLISLFQLPVEKDYLRVNIFEIEKTKDPLSSFLQIIMGAKNSLVLDGRRLYNMEATHNEKTNLTTINLTNYVNLWTDHKRSKFEKIAFEKNSVNFLPSRIFIYFDGRVFKLY